MPHSGTPAYFMSENCGPRSCKYLHKQQHLTKDKLGLQWPLWGMIQLDKTVRLRSALESKGSHIKQTECNAYFHWYVDASQKLQDSKIASLKNVLQNDSENLMTQDCKQQSANPLTLQLQQLQVQAPKITPGPLTLHFPRVHQ